MCCVCVCFSSLLAVCPCVAFAQGMPAFIPYNLELCGCTYFPFTLGGICPGRDTRRFAAYPPTDSQRTRAAALAMVVCRRSPLFLFCILLYRGWCLRRGRAARPYESDAWESPNNSLSQNGYGGGKYKKKKENNKAGGTVGEPSGR